MTREENVNSNRTIARIVGSLFLIATASYILGGALIDSVLDAPDFLRNVDSNSTQVEIGVLLKFVTAIANIGIGVLLFPILKQHSERIALGYLVTRIFDGAGIALSGIGALSLIALSRETIQAGTGSAADSVTLANLIVAGSDITYLVTMLALGLGAMPFCYLLYRTRLIPRPLAVLGFIGYAALFAGSALELVGVDLRMIHYVPGGLFEFILPILLIFRGFSTPAIASEPANGNLASDRATVATA